MLKLLARHASCACRNLFHGKKPALQAGGRLLLCFVLPALPLPAGAQTQLGSSSALYARVVRLAHNADTAKNGGIVASVTAFPASGTEAGIYASADGTQFTQIGAITDADFSGGLCCGTLYELPSQVGTLAPGTLLWAGSVGQSSTTQAMQLKVYESTDQGKTWSYLSNCATGTKPGTTGGGLWEPQFDVASDGALVCIYSDETQTGHSQVLRQVRSYEGTTWQDATNTVASTTQADRPGMAVVTKLPGGTYFMSYEICGTQACAAFYRDSSDGWNWGDATNLGTKIVTTDGQWFEHAPTNAWAASAATTNGTILLTGQMMYDKSGAVSSGNGETIFTNHSADGSGAWSTMPAPIKVPSAYDNYCPNYSSPLLPATDGQSVLEFASNYAGSTCMMYYATGAITAGTLTPMVTVTPASTSVTTAQAVNVTVTVAGTAGGPSPVGTVTLANGAGYTSTAATLSNGSASFTIPANTLAAGTATLTASYSGDANYAAASGQAVVTVTQAAKAGFTIGTANLTIKAGAATGNTVSITVTPEGGFTGDVTLTAQITSGPSGATTYYPTVSFGNTSPVSITDTSSGTATLTIGSTARSSALARSSSEPGRTPGAPVLALILFQPLGIFTRRAKRNRLFGFLVFLIALGGCLAGCGGGGGTSAVQTGTPAGTYVITITGTAGDTNATGTVTLTVA